MGKATGPVQSLLRNAAWAAHRAGLNVLPPREDGSKAPLAPGGTWTEYQRRRSTEEELSRWYGRRTGLGLVCGAISGNLELLEFDDHPAYKAFKDVAQATGLGDLVGALEAGYLERTPGIGVHWLYRCAEIGGSTKLARRPKTPEEMLGPGDKVKTLIETKGEGGFVIVSPSNGRVHPTGNPYVLLRGGVNTIVTITPEERGELWALARTLDQVPPAGARPPGKNPTRAPGGRPGADFNVRADWRDILEPHGWSLVYQRDGVGYWRRPGKSQGVSATTGYQGSGLLYVFSTSTVFEAERGYSKFSAHALLEHDGDFRAAAHALAGRNAQERVRAWAAGDAPAVKSRYQVIMDGGAHLVEERRE